MMNKIAGEVCSTVSDSHKTVYSHFPQDLLESNGVKLHSVGRLDCDTEGLLLFTNDGKLSNFLTRPENKIEKTYFVRLQIPVDAENRSKYSQKAQEGLILPAEKKFPEQKSNGAVIKWISETECSITLSEGKFHEVKRIFSALENKVAYLKRISFADIHLDKELKLSEWRECTQEEIALLKS